MKKLLIYGSVVILSFIILILYSKKDMEDTVSINLNSTNGNNIVSDEDNGATTIKDKKIKKNIFYEVKKVFDKLERKKYPMTGIYLKSSSGIKLIIDENNGPIVMENETGKEGIFNDLKSGDKIEITCGSIRETYPAGTEIYSCKLIERGDVDDIPQDALEKLQEMGWEFDI